MSFIELLLLALGLSSDAFAVSLSKGLSMQRPDYRAGFLISLTFGAFQALMPWIGWLAGSRFQKYIAPVDHWIAFVLLGFLGVKMIVDTLREKEENDTEFRLNIKELLLLGIATSIDALAAGVTFAVLDVNIYFSIALIGIVTLIVCFAGVLIGNRFGLWLKKKAGIFGGIILFLIGLKILLEHLGVISF